MPRAGPLRYWSLTLLSGALMLAGAAAVIWGTANLIGTDSCGTATTQECSSDTALHILAVVIGPFVAGLGGVLWAFRGAGTSRLFRRREKRVADMVARGEMAPPVVKRPTTPPPQLPSEPPSTWKPGGT